MLLLEAMMMMVFGVVCLWLFLFFDYYICVPLSLSHFLLSVYIIF